MPKKETPKSLLTKHLGKDAANALLEKIDKMIAKGESAAKIEKAVHDEVVNYIRLQLDEAVKAAVGPKEFIKLPPALMVNINKVIKEQIKTPGLSSHLITEKIGVKS